MQHLKWTKAHSVFLPQLDAEHRNLFRLAEELHDAVDSGADAATLKAGMQSLVTALDEHFTEEERLMRSAGADSYAWHKRQHDTTRKRGKQFLKQLAKGDAEAPAAFLDFLAPWFRDHIAVSDRMMSAQVRNRDRRYATASAS